MKHSDGTYSLWMGVSSRHIVERVVVEGTLTLETAASMGNGDTDDLIDMPLLVDPMDGRTPLLTGASIAGALRNYLRSREAGYFVALPDPSDSSAVRALAQERARLAVRLFGGFRADNDGEQSALIVDDALGADAHVETRDGVRIQRASRTAADKGLYNLRAWSAGTTFSLRFELIICDDDNPAKLKSALATALHGFNDPNGITLGGRKRRGRGRVSAGKWRVRSYRMTVPGDLIAWLRQTAPPAGDRIGDDIFAVLAPELAATDARKAFEMKATVVLTDSLLIRASAAGTEKGGIGPDTVHLHAIQPDGTSQPILAGTSLTGALRARAFRIANTLANTPAYSPTGGDRAQEFVEAMFGTEADSQKPLVASRLCIEERIVRSATTNLVQNRVSIDRFTGGARATALFNEQPIFGKGDNSPTQMDVVFRLQNPRRAQVGLLLLLLKDLWTEDLPLGGESSIGRGRTAGHCARLSGWLDNEAAVPISPLVIQNNGDGLDISGDRQQLEDCVTELTCEIRSESPARTRSEAPR